MPDDTQADHFQTIADLRRELARAQAERDEALAQQNATADVMQVINSSPGDLAPVFDAILEKAHTLCGADKGSLTTYDGEHFRTGSTRGLSQEYAAILRAPQSKPAGSPPDRLLRGETIVQVPDASVLPFPIAQAAAAIEGARTILYVPLRKDNALLGYITAYRQEVRPFTDKQIALLQNFAAQAVIAMENARLLTATRDALDQQTATAEVLQVINSSPGDLTPVFEVMLDRAIRLCEAAYGVLWTYNGEGFRAATLHGVPQSYAASLSQEPTQFARGTNTALGQIAEGSDFAHFDDVANEEGYMISGARRLIELGGARTVMVVALRKDGKLLGAISAFRQEVRPFADKQIALLRNFAAQAVIAMENARLLGELRARTDEVAGWNRELEVRVAAQLAEIERTGKLRRFLAPQLADLIVAKGDESILESHRREIVVVFCDLRGFTAFAERAEPEEVMALLRDYHAAMGPIVASFEGTLDHYAGDGIMVFFNDPLPTPDPAKRAIEMAVAMRATTQALLRTWRRHGHDIGFGVGISQGYATLGQIGFAERVDYTAIGTVTNLAARLCAEAKDGQILISARVAIAVEDSAALEEIGDLSLKGLSQAVAVYNVVAVGTQPSAS
jgi:class 3 adenylate cyclase